MLTYRLRARLTQSIDGWNYESHPMKKNAYGVFEIVVPAKGKEKAIPHNSKVKVGLVTKTPLVPPKRETCVLILIDLSCSSRRQQSRSPSGLGQICNARPLRLPGIRCSVLEPRAVRQVRLQASTTAEAAEHSHLRSPRRNLVSRAARHHLRRVHRQCAPQDQGPWLQCYSAHGHHGTRLLC
jgi:hypothetical protein